MLLFFFGGGDSQGVQIHGEVNSSTYENVCICKNSGVSGIFRIEDKILLMG